MHRLVPALALAGLSLGGCGSSGDAGPSYARDVQPIFQKRCSPCHAGDHDGDHDMAVSYADTQRDSYLCPGETKGQCALVQIRKGYMPYDKGCTGDPAKDAKNDACTTAGEQSTIEDWISAGLPP